MIAPVNVLLKLTDGSLQDVERGQNMNVLERLDALERAVAILKQEDTQKPDTFKYSRVKPLNTLESIERLNKIVGIEEERENSDGLQNL